MDITANRNVKDSLFKIIFGDSKENALALYNAVNGTNYTDSENVDVVTIKNAVYISIENDVAFIFDDSMNLYEHQSTGTVQAFIRLFGTDQPDKEES